MKTRIAAACGLMMMLATGCTALRLQQADPPKVAMTSLQLTGLTIFEQDFDVGLRLTNPNDFPLPIAGMTYTIQLNGEKFADGASNQAVTVPAMGDAEVHLTVHANMLSNL
ncbi:MAG TPA: LEA type 2 family protein, partial [Gammaproteobacteria bacterium]|nr:LEA type 2 family protein [Gammaproteobacteria bacterium]